MTPLNVQSNIQVLLKVHFYTNLKLYMTTYKHKGSSINDATVVGGRRGQGFSDNTYKASIIKSVTMGGRGDVI